VRRSRSGANVSQICIPPHYSPTGLLASAKSYGQLPAGLRAVASGKKPTSRMRRTWVRSSLVQPFFLSYACSLDSARFLPHLIRSLCRSYALPFRGFLFQNAILLGVQLPLL